MIAEVEMQKLLPRAWRVW
jgi:hypothetical protein